MLYWSIAACLKSRLIDRIIVSTDSCEYARLAVEMGAEAPFLRPEEISGDRATDYDCIVHAVDWLSLNSTEPEYVAHIRPTTPFRDPELIDEAINLFQSSSRSITALRSAHEMSESAYKTFEITADGRFKRVGALGTALDAANVARQQFPITYQANGYVDVLSTAFIRKNHLLHGEWVLPFITPAVVEVDTEHDFSLLEHQLLKADVLVKKIFN